MNYDLWMKQKNFHAYHLYKIYKVVTVKCYTVYYMLYEKCLNTWERFEAYEKALDSLFHIVSTC